MAEQSNSEVNNQDKDKPPSNDGKWIPKIRFDEAVGAERTKIADLQGRLHQAELDNAALRGQLSQQPERKTQPKKYTRSELRKLVNDGEISEDQADDILESQMRAELKRELSTDLKTELRTENLVKTVNSEIQRYEAKFPDVLVRGSQTRNRVQAEFDYLVGLGDPGDKTTELKALRLVLGPVNVNIEDRTNGNRETVRDSGGDGDGEGNEKEGSPWKGISSRLRTYYEAQIKAGRFAGVNDPKLKTELDIARRNPRPAK